MDNKISELKTIMDKVNETMKKTGFKYALKMVDITDCVQLKENARFMSDFKFKRLSENIQTDNQLASVPVVIKQNNKYTVLSGNHRVEASKKAGIEQIIVLEAPETMSKDEQIAVQLSHNAIDGQDDAIILKKLYEQIEAVEQKAYSGLSDEELALLDNISFSTLGEKSMDFRRVGILFLHDDIQRLKDCMDTIIPDLIIDDHTRVGKIADYDRLVNAMKQIKSECDIINNAESISVLLDVFEEYKDDYFGKISPKESEPETKTSG